MLGELATTQRQPNNDHRRAKVISDNHMVLDYPLTEQEGTVQQQMPCVAHG